MCAFYFGQLQTRFTGKNTAYNTVDQKIALPFYVMLILHLVICHKDTAGPPRPRHQNTVYFNHLSLSVLLDMFQIWPSHSHFRQSCLILLASPGSKGESVGWLLSWLSLQKTGSVAWLACRTPLSAQVRQERYSWW